MNKKIIFAISLITYFDNCVGADSILSSNSPNIPSESYVSPKSFETRNLKLEVIDTAEKDTACYQAIYQDCGWRNPWFSGVWRSSLYLYAPGSISAEHLKHLKEEGDEPIYEDDHEQIQRKDIEFFQLKEKLGIYGCSRSFTDYLIRDKETQELAGRFIFCDYEKDGRIEKGIYLLSKFRGKGYGSEALTGILKNVVDPAIDQPFAITYWDSDTSPKTMVYSSFKGVFSKIAPWCNYPSIAANIRSGCGVRWVRGTPITFYPRGDDIYMDDSDLDSFKIITRYSLLLEETDPTPIKERGQNLRWEFLMTLIKHKDSFIVKQIVESLYKLLETEDDSTFESASGFLEKIGEGQDINED